MHWLLFIHKILFSSARFEPQVLIFRRIWLYTCTQTLYRQATTNSHREWQYHMLHVYNYILLKMSTWGSKHIEENNILWINNNQYIKGKRVPLQAWSGPEVSRKLIFPDFMTTAQDGGKVVSLTHRPLLPPGNTPGTHFC